MVAPGGAPKSGCSRGGAPRVFRVYADFSRFVRDINVVKKKKHLVIDELFHG